MIHNDGNENWLYLPLASYNEALWQFDGTVNNLVDRTGNGHDLTLSTGTTLYTYNYGLVGLSFNGATHYTTTAAPAGLQILGDLTVEVQCQCIDWTAAVHPLVVCAASGETLATNALYSFFCRAAKRYTYFCEYGGGSDVTVNSDVLPTMNAIELVTFTRNGITGDVALYQNGRSMYTQAAVRLPEGGTSSNVRIGADYVVVYLTGAIYSVRISPVELSAVQVSAVYNAVRSTRL